MSQVISVVSGKGGTGRSVIAANLGISMAAMGQKVVVVELGFGLRSLDIMLGMASKKVYHLGDYLAGVSLDKVLLHYDRQRGLHLVMAAPDPDTLFEPMEIVRLLEDLRGLYDVILLDCPIILGKLGPVIASGCDMALAVSTPAPVCIRETRLAVDRLFQSGLKKGRLIINKVYPELIKLEGIVDLDDVIDQVCLQLIGVVPFLEEIASCAAAGKRINPFNKARKVFDNIGRRLQGEDVPLLIR